MLLGNGAQRPRAAEALLATAALAGLALLFWKVRIIDLGADPQLTLASVDLYISYYPMTWYGFSALGAGRLPLWNPYQFCGEPFLAVPYVGLFYPLNLVYLLFDVTTATEISFIAHMVLGGIGMWGLCRHLGVGALGGMVSGLTFMWSGWMIHNANQPPVFSALTWAPLTVLLFDLVLQGSRAARTGLAAAVACQILLGAGETFVHTMYAGALFALCRLVPLWSSRRWTQALRRGGILVACLAAGVLLSCFQLLPTMELTNLSEGTPAALSFGQAIALGTIPPVRFLRSALETQGSVTVGVLPLLGMTLVLGFRRHQLLWIFCVIAAAGAALLTFGDPIYRLHDLLPIGSMLGRPHKFLDIYCLAQALLVGLAVARLESWRDWDPRHLWTHPAWLGALALAAAGALWLASLGTVNPYLVAVLGLLLLFGIISRPRTRGVLITVLCLVQGVNLFFGAGNASLRPSGRPEIFDDNHELIAFLKEHAGRDRVYLSPQFLFDPSLTAKQGMLSGLNVANDYEPLAVGRYATFFDNLAGGSRRRRAFDGAYRLGATSRWEWLDLISVRYLVMHPGEPADLFLTEAERIGGSTSGFRLVRDGDARIFENRRALPRAYVVPRARVLDGSHAVLAALGHPAFDPRAEVLLEGPIAGRLPNPRSGPTARRAGIVVDEPERVVIDVAGDGAGFLVLTDLFYPGWRAFAGERELPVHRANYLFRAVRLDPGISEVRFEFRPASFHNGIALSGMAVLALVAITGWRSRPRPRHAR